MFGILFVNKLKRKLISSGSVPGEYRYFVLVVAGFCCIVLLYILSALSPVSTKESARDVIIEVPHRATAAQVGKILKQNGLVRSPLVFRLYARWKGLDGQIKAGEYRLSNSLSTPELLCELVEGQPVMQTFTIPEGFTTAQVADLLASKGLIDREDFFSAVASEDFPYFFTRDLPGGNRRLEGYLFPDTYRITKGSSESSIINMMLKRFEKEIKDLNYKDRAGKLGLTLHQAVTIASMIEREAKIDQEKPLIAGVIYNRMKRGMPLQIDATVQYALGEVKPKIYYKDLEIDSPYNTYKINGLPPGPIAMPGRSSLLAAVNPAQTEYLYYVAKPDGSHAFATTLAEHRANKERYLQ